jgi:hypothetical protein
MSTTRIVVHAPAEAVFDVLMRPMCYPRWVVGAREIRDVDPEWPTPGSSFHHTVGVGLVRTDDSTTLADAKRPDLVELRARAWPIGEADVRLELQQRGPLTRVTMHEAPARGPARAIWRTPAVALTSLRNRWSLRRLKGLVESGSCREAG